MWWGKKVQYYKNVNSWTSGQDGGLGRYTLSHHTTKRTTTTNLKTKKITRVARNLNCMEVRQPRS